MTNEIIIQNDFPPIPMRDFDWSAYRDGYDAGDLIGYGKTKEEAIKNLLVAEYENDLISDIELDGVDWKQYPEFEDAFIASAKINGVEMTEIELEILSENSLLVDSIIQNQLF